MTSPKMMMRTRTRMRMNDFTTSPCRGALSSLDQRMNGPRFLKDRDAREQGLPEPPSCAMSL